MPVRSIYNARFFDDIVGKAYRVEVADAATGAVTTKLAYDPPRVEAMGPLDGGFLLPLTGSGSGPIGPQGPSDPGCLGST
jgi:hypothetical protein